ncbi:MAG: KH domain-containing protein [Sulfurovum sp.]|nr:KH domain-containing protein [Sulfurovum sp.]MCB4745021.1 KH domain-containing protein [Sulfurovum sp.]MCB4746533.1 KH domain-containing protein [Sulfurovum sp.]MCB4748810.1 KH domain-containing protein [Sulfurovum sp.]MCB4750955.1 KH domain-containing protein [Sulfurovum sp.]
MVREFLQTYTMMLVNHPDDISIEIQEINEGFDEITIFSNKEDVGKLIGKDGRMINAIKAVISGCKAKGGKNYRVNVEVAI